MSYFNYFSAYAAADFSPGRGPPQHLLKITKEQAKLMDQYVRDSENCVTDYTQNFVYKETDSSRNEFAELYSYSEVPEFQKNLDAFNAILARSRYQERCWRRLNHQQKCDVVLQILDQMETVQAEIRLEATRGLLYILQGCWADLLLESEHEEAVRENVILLYRLGAVESLVDIFRLEINIFNSTPTFTIQDSERYRVVAAALYTMVEIFRQEKDLGDSSEVHNEAEDFCNEISSPIKGEFLVISLFRMIYKFVDGYAAYCTYSMRKSVLLLWKLLLVTFGGYEEAEKQRTLKRKEAKLPAKHENAGPVTRKFSRIFKKLQLKPKVRGEDYLEFLEVVRQKFLGFNVVNDHSTTAGLPGNICKSLETLRSYIYTPLSIKQIAEEELMVTYPFSRKDSMEIDMNPVEMVYQAMLPEFDNHIHGLTTLLVYCFPSKRRARRSFNPLTIDLLPREQTQTDDFVHNLVTHSDLFKHEEVILKATSSVILLLMKHLKVNHIYQFEFLAQCLVAQNILKVVNDFCAQPKMVVFLRTTNEVPLWNYPTFLIGFQPSLTMDTFTFTNPQSYSWRNMCLSINMLRIANKLIKWKPARVALMVSLRNYESLITLAYINNKTLKYYVLKMLKMQIRFLGRDFIKPYMSLITEMFYGVRYHLVEKFLCFRKGRHMTQSKLNRIDDEIILALTLLEFNKRRLEANINDDPGLSPQHHGADEELPDDFKRNYESWLEREVFSR